MFDFHFGWWALIMPIIYFGWSILYLKFAYKPAPRQIAMADGIMIMLLFGGSTFLTIVTWGVVIYEVYFKT